MPSLAALQRPHHLRALTRSTRHYSTHPPSTSPIHLTTLPAPHAGSIKILSLNTPSTRNALSTTLLSSLTTHISSIASEPSSSPTTRALIITSTTPTFCAGADLKQRLSFSSSQTQAFLSQLRTTFTALSTLPIPTISAVAGAAFGGGLELALCTSFRVFGSTARVGLPETRLGIVPGAGGMYRLPALVGTARARDLVLTGRAVSGAEAYFIGLCDRLVEVEETNTMDGRDVSAEGKSTEGKEKDNDTAREKVLEAAIALANEICMGGPVATRAALEAVNCWGVGEEGPEAEAYEKVLGTADRVEALRAFAEKRRPIFKGR